MLFNRAVVVKQFPGAVALHPVLEQSQVALVGLDICHWHLVRAPEVLNFLAVHIARTGPALGRAQYDHWPAWAEGFAASAGLFLLCLNVEHGLLKGHRHVAVHCHRVRPFHEDWRPAIPLEQALKLLVIDPAEDGRVGDFVSVQMQDRQYGAIADRVDEFVDVPAGGEWAGLGFPVADAGDRDQLGIVENRATSVGEHIAQFSPLMNGTRHLSGAMAADMPREGKHLEELAESFFINGFVGIALGVAAIDVDGASGSRCSMAGT